jgi:DNA-binding beta-propeller fold protein YncE
MDESSLLALFERAVAARPPTPRLVAESLRLGRKLRLRRRIEGAVASALVIGLVAAVGPIAFGALSHQAPAAGRHGGMPETLYAASSDGVVTPIRVGADVAGPTIQVARMAGLGVPLAVAPGGKVIYAASASGTITPIYPSTKKAGRPIRVTSHILGTILITRDGRTAYVMEVGAGVIPVNLASGRRGKLIRTAATQMVITPGGRTIYVLNNSNDVIPIRTATNTALRPIPVGESPGAQSDIAVSPDGATVYVLSGSPARSGGNLTPVSTATNTAQQPIMLPGIVMGMAIDPDGRTAYVTDYTRQHRYVLLPVDLATRKVLRPIRLPAQFWAVSSVAFTSDGRMGFIAIGAPGTARGTEVMPFRTATNTGLTPVRLDISLPTHIAVSPDGSTLYVTGEVGAGWTKFALFPIRISTNTAGTPISVPEAPVAMVFAP